LLEYLCQQSGKLYNSGVYLARQIFFKTGKLLTGKKVSPKVIGTIG
jgi:putative transposase